MREEINCFLVDGDNKTITKITIEDNVKKIRAVLGCESISVKSIDNNTDLLIDEKYKLRMEEDIDLFKLGDSPEPYIGKAIIISKDRKGYYRDTELTLENMNSLVVFFNLLEYNNNASEMFNV